MSNQGQRRAAKEQRRKVRKIKVVTNGRKVPGMPFMGESMTCVMCDKHKQSDPKVESQWRAIKVDGTLYYVCPDHFPPDATGTTEQFRQAFVAVLQKIYQLQQVSDERNKADGSTAAND